MNQLDLAILLTCLVATGVGLRLGFLRRISSWVGALLGLAISFAILPSVLEQFGERPRPQVVIAATALLLAGTLLGQAAGLLLGASFRMALPPSARVADRFAGGLLGAVVVMLLVWLLLPVMHQVPSWPAEQSESSAIADAIEEVMPEAPDALAGLRAAIGDLVPPTVFNDLTGPADVAAPPDTSPVTPEVLTLVSPSVARVSGVACGFLQQGSGFVVEPGLVVTNAHVVAGHEGTDVELPGRGAMPAAVVYFDPRTDLALLETDTGSAPPVVIAEPVVGEEGSVIGYPGGGPQAISPFGIAERVEALGSDIYSTAEVSRDVLVLSAELAPGDSGSPVISSAGAAVGIAFAVDPDSSTVAYALSSEEVAAALAGARSPTSAGACVGR